MSKKSRKKQSPAKSKPIAPSGKKATTSRPKIDFYSVALGCVVLAIVLIRIRLLSIPFERDEGEYAYMGKLILDGVVPYKETYNMKLPGTYFMYAFIMGILGSSPTGIHAGLMLISVGTIILLYCAFRKLFNPMVALVSATIYAIMSVSGNLLGFAAHATHFIVFFVALALFFYSRFNENRRWLHAWLMGSLFGLAFLMKQHAVFFIILGGLLVIVTEASSKPARWRHFIVSSLLYSAGASIPYLLVVALMFATGAFDKFWFWTVEYAGKYASSGLGWEDARFLFSLSFRPMFKEYSVIWILAVAGLLCVWLGKLSIQQKLLATFFGVLSFAAVCPGFYFRQHYFIVLLPAAGLFAAITLDYMVGLITAGRKYSWVKSLPFVIVLVVAVAAIEKNRGYYLELKPDVISKMIYGSNPFVESEEIAKYLKTNTGEHDRIAVLGSEPQIFVYADRRSATGHIYTYGLMELHDYNKTMQHEMIAEIETAKPKYMVYCNVRTSWLVRSKSPKDIFEWFKQYAQENYGLVGLIDISPRGKSDYFWDAAARRQPRNKDFIQVFRRKGE